MGALDVQTDGLLPSVILRAIILEGNGEAMSSRPQKMFFLIQLVLPQTKRQVQHHLMSHLLTLSPSMIDSIQLEDIFEFDKVEEAE